VRILFELEKENIKTKKKEERRSRDLEKIFMLDRKLEQMAITKQQGEFESLYPLRKNSEGTNVPADISKKSSSDTSHGISDNINRKVSTRGIPATSVLFYEILYFAI
jgi:membrane-associated HD superfamily phosphohydrolase